MRRISLAARRAMELDSCVVSGRAAARKRLLRILTAATARQEMPAMSIAAAADDASLPGFVPAIIDVARFTEGNVEERATVAAEWDDAFQNVGFAIIRNYGRIVPVDSLASLRVEAEKYFALPMVEKQRAHMDNQFGFVGPGAENVGATLGDSDAVPDLVEALNFSGYQQGTAEWTVANAEAECPWLQESFARFVPPRLRRAAQRYWGVQSQLMTTLMELSEVALDLPPGFFATPTDGGYDRPGCLLRLAHYIPIPTDGPEGVAAVSENRSRYGAHTDYDGFTILSKGPPAALDGEGGGGLEIQLRSGEWVRVNPPPDTLIINIGDLLARWTNDRWRATMHRVARPALGSAEARQGQLSVVFFSGPHPQTVVKCLPSTKCLGTAPPKYQPIEAFEHVAQKLSAATVASIDY